MSHDSPVKKQKAPHPIQEGVVSLSSGVSDSDDPSLVPHRRRRSLHLSPSTGEEEEREGPSMGVPSMLGEQGTSTPYGHSSPSGPSQEVIPHAPSFLATEGFETPMSPREGVSIPESLDVIPLQVSPLDHLSLEFSDSSPPGPSSPTC